MCNQGLNNKRQYCATCRFAVVRLVDDGSAADLFCTNDGISGKPNLVIPGICKTKDLVLCTDIRQRQFSILNTMSCDGYELATPARVHKMLRFTKKDRCKHDDYCDCETAITEPE